MKKNVIVLAEAAADIERGIDFYDAIEDGVGRYFRDSIITDIRRLGVYFGEHRIHLGFFRALASRFPYARSPAGCGRVGLAPFSGLDPGSTHGALEQLKCETRPNLHDRL